MYHLQWTYRVSRHTCPVSHTIQAADVASTAISNERTIESVLSTIKLIANSPEAIDSVTSLFKSVLQQPETQDAMNYLLTNLLADPYTKQIGVEYLMWVLQDEAMETWMNTQVMDEHTGLRYFD